MKLFDLLNTYAMAVPSCLIRGKDDRNLARMWGNWHMIPLERFGGVRAYKVREVKKPPAEQPEQLSFTKRKPSS